MQSVPITTDVVSSNPAQGEVYKIMWWSFSVTCGMSVVFSRYSSTNKTDYHDITEILLKVALNTIKLNQTKTKRWQKLWDEYKCWTVLWYTGTFLVFELINSYRWVWKKGFPWKRWKNTGIIFSLKKNVYVFSNTQKNFRFLFRTGFYMTHTGTF